MALSIYYSLEAEVHFQNSLGNIDNEVCRQVWILSERLKIQITELKLQLDHVYLLVNIMPKLSVSEMMGT